MARSSGKCTMYLVSLQGHGTSAWPGLSGAPTECSPGTNSPISSMRRSAPVPILVMMCIEATTYAESVISTPSLGRSEVSGPIQNGMTYIVRPRIEPRYSSVMMAFMSSGAIQLLVGPASRGSTEQMNVRSSTRATSVGSEAHQNELGFFCSSSRVNVPASTSRSVIRVHSAGEPSHHATRSGRVSSATSSTQARRRACRVGAASMPGIAETVMAHLLLVAVDRIRMDPGPPAVRWGFKDLTSERSSPGPPAVSAPSQDRRLPATPRQAQLRAAGLLDDVPVLVGPERLDDRRRVGAEARGGARVRQDLPVAVAGRAHPHPDDHHRGQQWRLHWGC